MLIWVPSAACKPVSGCCPGTLHSLKLEQHATLTCDSGVCICMQVPAQLEETIEDRVHAEEFEFTELQFIKSSRMSKRHLIFACRIRVSCPAVWLHLWPLRGGQCTRGRCGRTCTCHTESCWWHLSAAW